MQLKLQGRKAPPLSSSKANLTTVECIHFPSHVNSEGLWLKKEDPRWWLNNSLPLLQMQLVTFAFSLTIIHFVLKRLGVSKLSSQIITGLIFGCSWKRWDKTKFQLFTVQSEEILGLLAYFGYMLYLFLTAVKMDVTTVLRTGRKPLMIGIATFLVPLFSGIVLEALLVDGLTKSERLQLPLMITIHSAISFPVIASLLSELKIVSSELGRLGLSSALVSDLLSQVIMSVNNQIRVTKENPPLGYLTTAAILSLVVITYFAFRPAMLWIIKQTPEGKPVSRGYIHGVLFTVLVSAGLSNWVGQPAIFAPYILGLAVPDGAPLGSSLIEKLECFVSDMFMPIFVIGCALQVDLLAIPIEFDVTFTKLNIIIALVTVGIKMISCFLCAMYCKLPFRDSLALSFILCCKGSVDLSFCTMIKQYKIIDDGLLAYLTLIILLVATYVPIAVRWLYDPSRKYAGYQNRNIMHLNSNSELRVLACLHRNENIYGIVHLLNLSCPSVENPLAVYVLHLIELIGRTTPIFISHRLQNKILNDQSYSENIILSFEHFERENEGTTYVECFTSISPNKYMHNDICTLALDKFISLIILPFHRTWTSDGIVDQEDNMIRALNCCVLERAPCSVGIFADRGHLGRKAAMASSGAGCHYSVCMVYLGGNDDREALSYAKRMAKDSRVELAVIRLQSSREEDGSSSSWEKMLDSEALKSFKMTCLEDGIVTYKEEVCEDGPQTALRLRELVNDYDLMIVGRRNGLESPQTAGLSEWNEFPELGVLGDLIASTDINNRASVLVIQQQMID